MASTYATLSYGASGSDVRELQEALNRHGYTLEVDGVFGTKTRAAVRAYQKKKGLKLDGIVGQETWGSLMARTPDADGSAAPAAAVSGNTAQALSRLEQGFVPSADTQAGRDYADSLAALAPGEYESAFEAQLSALYEQLAGREAFSYDPRSDEAFRRYVGDLARTGRAAMEDTLAQSAHLSGGYGSSYAQSAAQQVYYDHLARAGEVLPKLQAAAYEQYLDEGAALLERYGLLQQQDKTAYGRYLEEQALWREDYEAAAAAYEAQLEEERRAYQLLLDHFSDKAKAEAKGEAVSATAPTAASAGTTLSSKGAESLEKAMTNYLKSGDRESAVALCRRYEGRASAAQLRRWQALLARYGAEL